MVLPEIALDRLGLQAITAAAGYIFPSEKAPNLGGSCPGNGTIDPPSLAFNPAGIGMERTLFRTIFPLCALDSLVDTWSPFFRYI